MKMKQIVFAISIGALVCSVGVAQDAIAVITNPSVGVSEMSKADVADVFSGTKNLVGSATVKVYILMPDQAASQALFEHVIGTTAVKFNQQWLRKTFSGGGSAPTRMTSSAEMIKAVASNPGAIGYILKSEAGSAAGCKTVFTN